MILDSKNTEFGYELIATLPYAYWLHTNNQLDGTISAFDTKPLYFFSKNHIENAINRSWYNTPKASEIPNINIHKANLDLDKWIAPPLKEYYKDKSITFDKQTVIICNRYNIEWNVMPINYFDLDTLRKMFDMLRNKYQIIYIHFQGLDEYQDNAILQPLGDFELIENEYKNDVITLQNLKNKYKNISYNELQLRLFAGCQRFITMNGGHGILASYFGGTNIIYSKKGNTQARELGDNVNSFNRWYYLFGQSNIQVVNDYEILLNKIQSLYIDNQPLINILTRTFNRPNYFEACCESIGIQNYNNTLHIVGTYNDYSSRYTQKYKCRNIRYSECKEKPKEIFNNENYGKPCTYNEYLNILTNNVNDGWLMYLDDDDILLKYNTLQTISEYFNNQDNLILWKVNINGRIIPENKDIEVCKISGIGFCVHSKHKELIKWTNWRRADFRLIKYLSEKLNVVWIDEILTSTQDINHFGNTRDKNKLLNLNIEDMYKTMDIVMIAKIDRGRKIAIKHQLRKGVPITKALVFIHKGIAFEYKEPEKIEQIEKIEVVKEVKEETVTKELKLETNTKNEKRRKKSKNQISEI